MVAPILFALLAAVCDGTPPARHAKVLADKFGPVEDYWSSFPCAWFGANMYGTENRSQVEEIGRYKLVVLGWQHEIWSSNFTRLGPTQAAQLRALKAAHPSIPVFSYLSAAWAPPMWDAIADLVHDPSVRTKGGEVYDYFLQSTGQLSSGNTTGPGPLFSDTFCGQVFAKPLEQNCRALYWNFAHENMGKYLAQNVTAPLALLGVDGVFFDGIDFTLHEFEQYTITNVPGTPAEQQDAWWAGIQAWQSLTATVTLPMFSEGQDQVNFLRTNGSRSEEDLHKAIANPWVRYYEGARGEDAFPLLENMLIEAELNIPVVMHVYTNGPDEDITTHLALFLIARGDYFYFMASTGWLDDNWHWYPEYDRDYGVPIGKAVRKKTTVNDETGLEPVVYTRNFTKSFVTLTCYNETTGCVGAIDVRQ